MELTQLTHASMVCFRTGAIIFVDLVIACSAILTRTASTLVIVCQKKKRVSFSVTFLKTFFKKKPICNIKVPREMGPVRGTHRILGLFWREPSVHAAEN